MSVLDYIVYGVSTGKILRYGTVPASSLDDQASEVGEGVMEGVCDSDLFQYIDDADPENIIVVDKQLINYTIDKPTITADGVDEATVSGLPIPCTIHHDGAEYVVDDGSFEFVADQPGAYLFTIDELEYITTEFTIDAN